MLNFVLWVSEFVSYMLIFEPDFHDSPCFAMLDPHYLYCFSVTFICFVVFGGIGSPCCALCFLSYYC
jgi:hypothetical protein